MKTFEEQLVELSFEELLNAFEEAAARFHVDIMFGVVDEPLSKTVLAKTRTALIAVYAADNKMHWGQGYHDGWQDGQDEANGYYA